MLYSRDTYQPGDVLQLTSADDNHTRRFLVTRRQPGPAGSVAYDLLIDPEDEQP